MNRYLVVLGTLFLILFESCSNNSNTFTLTGKLDNLKSEYITIGSAISKIQDTVYVNEDGSFKYQTELSKPSMGYIVSENPQFFAMILFIKGTESHLTADASDMESVVISGDLEKEYEFFETNGKKLGELLDVEYESFTQMKNAIEKFKDSFNASINRLSNKEYIEYEKNSFESIIDITMGGYYAQLIKMGMPLDSDNAYNQYMESLDWNKISQSELCMAYLTWRSLLAEEKGESGILCQLALAEEKIEDVEARSKVVAKISSNYFAGGADADIEQVYQVANVMLTSEKEKAHFDKLYESLKKYVPGADAVDCILADKDGNESKLSDLYGKVLYIDVWATWCGPCCEEIPYVEKLVERFKGNDKIEFVSISIDSDKKGWLKKIEEDKPVWKQFLCGSFANTYAIAGIPCFMMIDPAGKIITMKAPRPSDTDACIDFINSCIK